MHITEQKQQGRGLPAALPSPPQLASPEPLGLERMEEAPGERCLLASMARLRPGRADMRHPPLSLCATRGSSALPLSAVNYPLPEEKRASCSRLIGWAPPTTAGRMVCQALQPKQQTRGLPQCSHEGRTSPWQLNQTEISCNDANGCRARIFQNGRERCPAPVLQLFGWVCYYN